MRSLSFLLLLAAALIAAPIFPAGAEKVLIYRCVTPSGTLTLRDSPCARGETQQVRSMVRPRDAGPAVVPARMPATPPEAAPRREVQVVYRTPARPMYECVTADGERYSSDNDDGNPRWVPLWTTGYPAWSHRGGGGHGNRPPRGRPDGGHRPPPAAVILPAGNTWVRDECDPLPQQEVCARLSDRRYEIIRRYNSALQSERRQLELEQRGIDARIDNDCGSQ